jgi:hypothetical protein
MINNNLKFNNYIRDKFNDVHKTYNSLYNYGTRPNGLNPFTKAHIYKTFCLPKALYSLSLLTLSDTMLKKLDNIQNMILRNTLGLSKFNHLSDIKYVLKIANVENVYLKYKCTLINLLKRHSLCNSLMEICCKADNLDKKSSISADIVKISGLTGLSVGAICQTPLTEYILSSNIENTWTEKHDRITQLLTDYNKVNLNNLREETFIFNA